MNGNRISRLAAKASTLPFWDRALGRRKGDRRYALRSPLWPVKKPWCVNWLVEIRPSLSHFAYCTAPTISAVCRLSANAPYGPPTNPCAAAVLAPVCDRCDWPKSWPDVPGDAGSTELQRGPSRHHNWSPFEPITGLPNYLATNRIPYTEGIPGLARPGRNFPASRTSIRVFR